MGTHQLRKLLELRAQNGERAAVGDRQRQVLCEYEYAGGQIGEDVFEARLCRLERRAARLQHPPRFLELTGHRIERLGEHAELIAAGYRRVAREVPARHCLHRLRERSEWVREELRLRRRDGD